MIKGEEVQVSIIMVNLNGEAMLKDWFETLACQTFSDFEVVVVDNDSRDASCRLIKELSPGTKLIKNKANFGFPKACNQGADLALGKYLLFLNNDLELEKDCLENLIAFMEANQEVTLAGPAVFSGDKSRLDSAGFFPTLTGFFLYQNKIANPRPYEVFGVSGAAMLVRKKAFFKVGGFDAGLFLYGEEVDLALKVRMILAGQVWLVPQAKLYHLGGQTTKKADKGFIAFHSTKSRLYLLLKSLSWPFLLVILPIHLGLLSVKAFCFLLLGKIVQVRGVVRGIFWNIKKLGLILKKRNQVQDKKQVSDWIIFTKHGKLFPVRRFLETGFSYLKTW
ncbi:MAG: glycosyltransferase family 2 protein [Candidatus Pacebacteria bacterium]|nr:glycosyltransferase family 2 protein [Candidatus Paceibacterota bacterium]